MEPLKEHFVVCLSVGTRKVQSILGINIRTHKVTLKYFWTVRGVVDLSKAIIANSNLGNTCRVNRGVVVENKQTCP